MVFISEYVWDLLLGLRLFDEFMVYVWVYVCVFPLGLGDSDGLSGVWVYGYTDKTR
jgi:hypothetical protein